MVAQDQGSFILLLLDTNKKPNKQINKPKRIFIDSFAKQSLVNSIVSSTQDSSSSASWFCLIGQDKNCIKFFACSLQRKNLLLILHNFILIIHLAFIPAP